MTSRDYVRRHHPCAVARKFARRWEILLSNRSVVVLGSDPALEEWAWDDARRQIEAQQPQPETTATP